MMCYIIILNFERDGVKMKNAVEIYNIIMHHSKIIRESLGDSKYIYGEIYADAVFGVLLYAVPDNQLKMQIVEIAFEKYRSKAAMCVSLEREELAAEAMNTAAEMGIAEAIRVHLGVKPHEVLIDDYINDIKV